jgi:hypothetical protein
MTNLEWKLSVEEMWEVYQKVVADLQKRGADIEL